MFYKLIKRKRDQWVRSSDCMVTPMFEYMERRGMLRDAQLEAIKTYLFLKIKCKNKPLWKVFSDGTFASMDFGSMSLTEKARMVFEGNKAAATMYEYACMKDEKDDYVFPALKSCIEEHPDEIDYEQVFRRFFYGVEYPDYIFSLPMGAGKTFLMAAFIYIDLYFSLNEPDNPVFSHNFIVLAPSGLKSSIVPSIKHIQDFDPTWILPEPAASRIKNEIQFEVLDEQSSAKKSNIVKNPNAQKINNHQPLDCLRGLVAVTNAEKVILDKIEQDKGNDPNMYTPEEWKAVKNSNELRDIISRIPHLSILIDEVHHASDGDIKLRQVVNRWTESQSFNSVLGFSGTPYLANADSVDIGETLSISNKSLANVVYYYPLVDGVGNFLKTPEIKISTNDDETIVRNGVNEFLDKYGNTVYANGTCAKLAIYCGRIDNMEERVYPLVCGILADRGLNPHECVLKYHGGNNKYPSPESSALEFASLDTPLSKVRIVLLAQIGKEGWDCRSLTGVILPHKGACPQNMVLQTSCRCLREVDKQTRDEQTGDKQTSGDGQEGTSKHKKETALIWLNQDNAKILNKELDRQQHTSIDELNSGCGSKEKVLQRFSRMEALQLPPVDFYQLKASYNILQTEESPDTAKLLSDPGIIVATDKALNIRQDIKGNVTDKEMELIADEEALYPTSFSSWLHTICKESFNSLGINELYLHEDTLRNIFAKITEKRRGILYPNRKYNHKRIRSLIRLAFIPKKTLEIEDEIIPEKASILKIDNLKSPVITDNVDRYYPDQQEVNDIIAVDNGKLKMKPEIVITIASLEKMAGMEAVIRQQKENPDSYDTSLKNLSRKTYHYLPYHFDSGFEINYFSESLLAIINKRNLEVYFNGDDTLTDFKIKCYNRANGSWRYVGLYTPDFLLISRDAQNHIKQMLIIETKGEVYAEKFRPKRDFMSDFIKINNEKFGYERCGFLYIEDSMKKDEQDKLTISTINEFFK